MAEQTIIKKGQNTLLIFSLLIFLVAVVAAGFFYVLQVNKQSNLTAKKAKLDALNQQLAAPDLASVAKEAETFQQGISGFQAFLSRQLAYSEVFKKLQSLLPKDVRLSNLSFGEKRDLKVDGEAGTLYSAAKFMAALEASGNFSEATLVSVNQSESASGKKFTFSLNTGFLGLNK